MWSQVCARNEGVERMKEGLIFLWPKPPCFNEQLRGHGSAAATQHPSVHPPPRHPFTNTDAQLRLFPANYICCSPVWWLHCIFWLEGKLWMCERWDWGYSRTPSHLVYWWIHKPPFLTIIPTFGYLTQVPPHPQLPQERAGVMWLTSPGNKLAPCPSVPEGRCHVTLFKKIRCHTHGTRDDLIHSKVVCDTQFRSLREIELHADRMGGLYQRSTRKEEHRLSAHWRRSLDSLRKGDLEVFRSLDFPLEPYTQSWTQILYHSSVICLPRTRNAYLHWTES